jgi:hypothetical protein
MVLQTLKLGLSERERERERESIVSVDSLQFLFLLVLSRLMKTHFTFFLVSDSVMLLLNDPILVLKKLN